MSTVWEELYQQGKIWEVTRNLLDCFIFGDWPSNAAVLDFGIASRSHYDALRYSIFFDDKPEWSALGEDELDAMIDAELRKRTLELNSAIKHGGKLTAFVQKYAPEHLARITFDTGMDEFAESLEEGRKALGH